MADVIENIFIKLLLFIQTDKLYTWKLVRTRIYSNIWLDIPRSRIISLLFYIGISIFPSPLLVSRTGETVAIGWKLDGVEISPPKKFDETRDLTRLLVYRVLATNRSKVSRQGLRPRGERWRSVDNLLLG